MTFQRYAPPHARTAIGATMLGATMLGAIVLATPAGCSAIVGDQAKQCASDRDCQDRGFADAVCRDDFCVEANGTTDTGSGDTAVASTGLPGSSGETAATDSTGGPDPDDPWGCVGNVQWDEEQEQVPARTGLHFTNSMFQPYPGATLQACSPLDVVCDPPLSTGVSDRMGDAFADVYYGFDGYFRAPPPEAEPDLLPFILYIYPPPFTVETEARNGDVLLIDQPTIDLLASLSAVEVEPDTGYIFFTAQDCFLRQAAGVTVSISPVGTNTQIAYLEGSFPNAALTETDASGQGAIINVPPGLVEVIGVSLEAGKLFERTVLVETDHITGIPIVPAPL